MNLDETFDAIRAAFGPEKLKYLHNSGEDNIGGWDGDERKFNWPVGSIWSVEGIILYELITTLEPEIVVEIGSRFGCSATHIAAALEANGHGRLICVDNKADGVVPLNQMNKHLRANVELVDADGADWVENKMPEGVGFIFEDCDHHTPTVERIWRAAAAKLAPGGMIVSHDAMHFLVGEAVRQGIVNSGVEGVHYYLTEPSDCGLAIWRKPGESQSTLAKVVEGLEKPKRSSRKKKNEGA